jgi:phage shock protein PspC (stress-responsive transcriptional regulator)
MTEYTSSSTDKSASGAAAGAAARQTTLTRPTDARMLAGVASGLADYTGVSVILVRIAFVVVTFLGGAGIPVYLACWLLMPAADTGQSIAGNLARDLRASSQNL